MQLVVFILVYPILWLISKLPFYGIYFISDLVFYLLYYIIGYRKKVVLENLKLVFPENSIEQNERICIGFYKHLCDMFLEMIKTISISEKELQKRFTFRNIELIKDLESKNRSIMTFFPHYASWEWTTALDSQIQCKGHAIYQPLSNIYFDKLVRKIRGKFGTRLISTRETPKIVRSNKKNNILSIYGILSDQSPMRKHANYWASFMGIKVPVHVGAEVLSKKLDLSAVYLKVEKLKRGHYQGTFIILAEEPQKFANYKITDAFLNQVEKAIKEAPEFYFWTHKRWKHRGKVPTEYKN